MTFLPIVTRELRVRSRKPVTYGIRFSGAVVGAVIASFLLIVSGMGAPPGSLGSGMFGTLTGLTFLFCLFEGSRQTADCLSAEKRAGTLGLLFLTDLKGYDVVLGKWMAASLNSVYVLMAILPVLAIPLLLGGVTGGEFWRVVLVLLSTLLLSLNLGMFVSAAGRDERRVFWNTIAVMFFLAVVPSILVLLPWSGAAWIGWASPFNAYRWADASAYGSQPGRFWGTLLVLQSLAWAFLLGAALILPRAWQDSPALPARAARRRASRQPRRPAAWLEENPVLWLSAPSPRQRSWFWVPVLSFAGVACLLCYFLIFLDNGAEWFWFVLLGGFLIHTGLAIWVAFHASYLLPEARKAGELHLLLATPLSDQDIIHGYFSSLKKLFYAPAVTLAAVELALAMIASGVLFWREAEWGASWFIIAATLLVVISFFCDLYAASYFGLWMGLRGKAGSQAFARTAGFLFILPMAIVFCCSPATPILTIVKDIVLWNYARDQLRRRFRQLAAEQG